MSGIVKCLNGNTWYQAVTLKVEEEPVKELTDPVSDLESP